MDETNFDWDDLRLFLAVARGGGLAAAAESCGKSAPTLGRRMLDLERRLGRELFVRLPRGYELTADGESLLAIAVELEAGIAPMMAGSGSDRVRRVKISAGTWTSLLLSQHVQELGADNSVTLQFIAADHNLDIPHREAVIGIRNQRPTHVGLAGRCINTVKFALYATNDSVTTWAVTLGETPSAQWAREHTDGASVVEISHPRNALDMASTGTVKTVLPTFIGDSAKELVRVSNVIDELEHQQWLVTHHEDRHLPEVRRVIEAIDAVLGRLG